VSTHRTPLSLTTYLGLVLDEATDLCAFDGLYGRDPASRGRDDVREMSGGATMKLR
jgi:hypothetical protein